MMSDTFMYITYIYIYYLFVLVSSSSSIPA